MKNIIKAQCQALATRTVEVLAEVNKPFFYVVSEQKKVFVISPSDGW